MGGSVDAGADKPDRRSRRIVLLGAPGCGKGTQACYLAGSLKVPAISTGEMLRAAVNEGSELGRQVADVMSAGALVDDELMAEVVRDRLSREDASGGFVLDGYPRTAGQCQTLDAILAGLGVRVDAAVLLEVPEAVLVERALGRGRADDREDVIRERLRVYEEKTAPVVDFYRQQGLLAVIDGNREIEVVTKGVLSAVGVA